MLYTLCHENYIISFYGINDILMFVRKYYLIYINNDLHTSQCDYSSLNLSDECAEREPESLSN